MEDFIITFGGGKAYPTKMIVSESVITFKFKEAGQGGPIRVGVRVRVRVGVRVGVRVSYHL